MTLTSQVIGFVKMGIGTADSTLPFGGINIILLGDFHQFPPVANTFGSLYSTPSHSKIETSTRKIGHNIYSQFQTVITLKQQMRITDKIWSDILEQSRTGDCIKSNLEEIRKLVLTNPACSIPNFNDAPWDNVVLITPWNIMHQKWNGVALH